MTGYTRHPALRLLVLAQIVLVVAGLVAPLGTIAATASPAPTTTEPSATPDADPSDAAVASPPTVELAADPTPEATIEPTAAPTPESTAEPSAEPSSASIDAPSAPADPPPEPTAEPSIASSESPSGNPTGTTEPAPAPGTVEYIVTFASGTTPIERANVIAAAGAELVDSVSPLRLVIIRVSAASSALDTLRADGNVTRVEADRTRAAEATPDDPRYDDQWSLATIGWDQVYGAVDPSGSAVVAVLDTGVDGGHADLAGQLVGGTSMLDGSNGTTDPNGHGTAMAGIIAAATDNGSGIAGIGFDGVKVMPVTVLGADGLGQDSDIIEGIVWAVQHGADVINMSFSNPGYSAALQAAIDYAWSRNVIVVAATGNDGSSATTYPAGDRGVVGVSNTDQHDALDDSSNHGADTFLGAPGTDIRTLSAGGGTETVTGTSASSAEVAAAAALLRAIDPGASNAVIVGRLARSAAAIGTRDETGNGRLDLARAVADDGTDPVTPAGVAATGQGGPFIGPYVAAAVAINPATTLNGSTGTVSVTQAASVALVISETNTLASTWGSSAWAFAATPPAAAAMTCVNTPDHAGNGTFTAPVTVTAPVAVGTYNLYLYAYTDNACTAGESIPQFERLNALTVTPDTTAPTVTINQAAAQADPATASPVNFTVVFSEAVTGFATGDITFTGTSGGTKTGTVTGGPTTYNVAVTGMTTSGTIVPTIATGVATDPAGNPNAASTSTDNTVNWAATPTVTINQAVGQPDPTNAMPVHYTVVFSEAVTGFVTGDVTFSGTSGGTKVGTITGGPTTFNVAVTGLTTSGTIIATLVAGVAVGAVGGRNSAASTSADNTVTWDVVAPTVVIDLRAASDSGSSTTDNLTNAASPIFDVTFNGTVTGLAAADFSNVGSATGCVVGAPAGAGPAYNVTLTGCSEGTVVLRLAAAGVTDPAGNPNAETDGPTVTIDRTAPAVTINQAAAQADPTNVGPVNYTVVFSETVTGFATGDVTFTGSTSGGTKTGTVSGGPATFNVAVTGMTTSGSIIAIIAAARATDIAGNANAASTSTDNTVTWDVTGPTVTINQAAGQPDPTAVSPVSYTVTFSEAVTGFVTGDVTFAGTSGGTKVGTVTGGPTVYTVTVTGMTTTGTIIATVAAGVANDLPLANPNSASTSTDNTVTWDVTAPANPTVNIVPAFVNLANRAAVQITVAGEVGATVALTITDGTTTIPLGGTIPAGGTLTVTPNLTTLLDGTVTATATLTDAAGNASGTGSDSATKDTVAPTVTINQAAGQADPTNAMPVNFTVVFSEPVTGFVTGDVTFSGTSGGTKVGTITGGPTTFNVAVTGLTTSGTVVAAVAASRATDLAGNNNAASTSADNTVTWDVVAPTVVIDLRAASDSGSSTTDNLTNAASPIFDVTFNGTVTGLAAADFSNVGSATGCVVGAPAGAGPAYNVTLTGCSEGTVVLRLAAAGVTDPAGNPNAETDGPTVTIDRTAPAVTINQAAAQADPTNVGPVNYTVVFSETVTGFATGDVTFTGSTSGGTKTGTVSGGPATFNVAVTGMTTSGSIIAIIAAARATDIAGNANAASSSTDNTVTWDVTGPTVTINQAAGQPDPTAASPVSYTVTFSEAVTGFVTGDVTFAGTSGGTKVGTVTGGPTVYTVTVTGMTTTGTIIATVAAGVANDLPLANPNSASTSTDNTVTWDVTAPANPTVNIVPAFVNLANRAAVQITVAGEVGATVALTITDGTTTIPLGGTIPAGGTLTVTPNLTTLLDGTVTATATLTDAAGNASGTGSDSATKDTVAPTVTINQAAGQADPTNAMPVNFTVVFSEPVTGFVTGDVTFSGTSGGTKVGTITGGPTTFNVAVTGLTTSGTVVAAVAASRATDLAGNNNAASTSADNTVTWDVVAPTVVIDQAGAQPDPTNVSPISYTVTFSEAVTGFATGDVTFGGTAGGAKTGTVTGGPTVYTIAVTGMTTSGTIIASIAAGAATDLAGNDNAASTSTDDTVTWDRATHLGFVQAPTDTVYGSTIAPAVTVAVLDASDQVVTESGVSITLALAPAGPTFGGTLTVPVVSGVATFSDLTVGAVGTYHLDASSTGLTGASSPDFDITPAPLTITADDRSKPYGQPVAFAGTEFSSVGLLGSDTVTSVTLTSAGAAASATVTGSPYPITASAAVGTGLANYAITYVDGALTVDPIALTITADDVTKTYGDTVTFAGTEITAAGLVNTDTVGSVTLSSAGAPATAQIAGSPYPITPSAAVGAGLANYTITYVDGELTVDPATLTITADDRTKTYGQTVVFAGTEVTTAGLVNGDTVDAVTLTSAGAAATATVAGSPYAITPSAAVGPGVGNYAITYIDGALTVDPATLTITADDQSKPFGILFTFAGTEFTTAGLANADTVDSATLTSAGVPALAAPGTYPIAVSAATGTGLANYVITYVDGMFTVGNTAPAVGDADVTTGATQMVAGSVTVSDPDTGQTVTLAITAGPTNGTATVANDGSFTYTPTGSFTGHDTFTIQGCDDAFIQGCSTGTVTVAVHPVAVDDQSVIVEGTTVEVDVQANDLGDAGPVQIITGPAHGTAIVGSIIYTPDAGFTGTDQVTYRVCSSNDPALCDDGTLVLTVASSAPPETDTTLMTPIGPMPKATVPIALIVLLLTSVLGGALTIARRRRDTD